MPMGTIGDWATWKDLETEKVFVMFHFCFVSHEGKFVIGRLFLFFSIIPLDI